MSFARKMKRKGLNKTSCCGEQMWFDNLSWFADEYDEYVCHKCGKRKLIKKEAENE